MRLAAQRIGSYPAYEASGSGIYKHTSISTGDFINSDYLPEQHIVVGHDGLYVYGGGTTVYKYGFDGGLLATITGISLIGSCVEGALGVDGTIYFQTWGGNDAGILVLKPDGTKLAKSYTQLGLQGAAYNKHNLAVTEDGKIYVVSNQSIYVLDGQSLTIVSQRASGQVPSGEVCGIALKGNSTVYVAVGYGGLFECGSGGQTYTHFTGTSPVSPVLLSNGKLAVAINDTIKFVSGDLSAATYTERTFGGYINELFGAMDDKLFLTANLGMDTARFELTVSTGDAVSTGYTRNKLFTTPPAKSNKTFTLSGTPWTSDDAQFKITAGSFTASLYADQEMLHVANIVGWNLSGDSFDGMMGQWSPWTSDSNSHGLYSYYVVQGPLYAISGGSLNKVTMESEAASTLSLQRTGGAVSFNQSFWGNDSALNNWNRGSLVNPIASAGFILPTTGEGAPVVVGGKVVGEISSDPRDAGVTYNGDPLPAGSIVRNIVDGQKFIAGGASATDFVAIEKVPLSAWEFSPEAAAAWAILQGY